jgi:hypothetical protein
MIESYFDIKELVCPHVWNKFKDRSWMFLDSKLLITLNTIRERIDRSIYVNDYNRGLDERGLRCNLCSIVRSKTDVYISAHVLGKAVDFDVAELEAEEIRLWIAKNKNIWPYPIRLEKNVNWVHLDVLDMNIGQKVYFFEK